MLWVTLSIALAVAQAEEPRRCGSPHETSCKRDRSVRLLQMRTSLQKPGPGALQEPEVCCQALTANCRACSQGLSVEDFCADPDNYNIEGCQAIGKHNFHCGQPACTQEVWDLPASNGRGTCGVQIHWAQEHVPWTGGSLKAACNFVAEQVTTPECRPCGSFSSSPAAEKPAAVEEPKACCKAATAECMACWAGICVEDFCKSPAHLDIKGCENFGMKSYCGQASCTAAVWNTPASNGKGTCGQQIRWVQAYEPWTGGSLSAACDFVAAQASTPECQACASGRFILPQPKPSTSPEVSRPTTQEPVMCCQAMTAECLACSQGISVKDFCADPEHDDVQGCKKVVTTQEPVMCCQAMTAECLACGQGISVKDFCADPEHDDVQGCEKVVTTQAPAICCQAMTAECLACSQGISVEDYCKEPDRKDVEGCEEMVSKR